MVHDMEILELLRTSPLVAGSTKDTGLTPEILMQDAKQIAVLLNRVEKYEVVIDNDPNTDRVSIEKKMLASTVDKLSGYEEKYRLRFDR